MGRFPFSAAITFAALWTPAQAFSSFSQLPPFFLGTTTNLATDNESDEISHPVNIVLPEPIRNTFIGLTIATVVMVLPHAALADGQTKDFRLPPIDFADKDRCILKSSSMGQANAARDKLYDLRMCDLSGAQADGFDLSGVILTKTNLAGANLKETYFSKGYLRDSNFDGADFTNAIVDRASFKGSSLRGTIFKNAVLTGTSFEDADVEGADFSEAALGSFDIRGLCKNPSLKGENPTTGRSTRETVECGP